MLSVAGIRVHHVSSAAEVNILLKLTSAGVVLIDLHTIGLCGEMLSELVVDFPEVCTVVLSPFDSETSAQLYIQGAWEVVVEPARLQDLLAALESAHELHQQLVDPVQLHSRVNAIMRAFAKWRKVDDITPGALRMVSRRLGAEVLTMRVVWRFGPVH